MATIGPRELDLAWLVFAHRVFETIAAHFGLSTACRTSCARRTSQATYAELTGSQVGDLDWYLLYAAVQ